MYARQLLKAAQLVGLSQSEIARSLSVTRSLVNLWSRNKRLVPKRYHDALATLVADAVQRALTHAARPRLLGEMMSQDAVQRALTHAEMPQAFQNLKARLTTLCNAWQSENMEAQGTGPSASVHGALEALEAYKSMTPSELRKPSNAQRLQDLSVSLYAYATLLNNMVQEDTTHVDSNPLSHAGEPKNAG